MTTGLTAYQTSEGIRLGAMDLATQRVAPLPDSIDTLPHWLESMAAGRTLEADLVSGDLSADARLAPPVAPGARIFCVAQNYNAHAQEASGTDSPPSPIVFLKPRSSFVAHRESIVIPAATEFLDYEAEVAIFIGRRLSRGTAEESLSAVAGFSLANDGTARDLQKAEIGGKPIVDWFSAKSLDLSSSLGPAIIPISSLDDPWDIHFSLSINGEQLQGDSTASMTFSTGELLSFLSHRLDLMPGDVVLSGTPSGVGKARGRPMLDGDVVSISSPALGHLQTDIRTAN